MRAFRRQEGDVRILGKDVMVEYQVLNDSLHLIYFQLIWEGRGKTGREIWGEKTGLATTLVNLESDPVP